MNSEIGVTPSIILAVIPTVMIAPGEDTSDDVGLSLDGLVVLFGLPWFWYQYGL